MVTNDIIDKDEYELVKKEYIEDKRVSSEKPQKKKGFNSYFKWSKRASMNKTLKKPDLILVFLINLKKQLEGPIPTKIYGGNFLVVRNHIYRFNPDRVLSFQKYKVVIAREFDRELVGVDDFQELVIADFASKNPGSRVNIDDPVLIKALIQAKLSEKPVVGMSAAKWIIIGLIVVGLIVGFFLLTGKKNPTPTITPTPVITPPTP